MITKSRVKVHQHFKWLCFFRSKDYLRQTGKTGGLTIPKGYKENIMPIFEFICDQCGNQFECLIFPSDQESPSCPECSNRNIKKLMSAGSVRPQGIPSGSGGFALPKCMPSGG
jgi:putative FmdB family regulatory protein